MTGPRLAGWESALDRFVASRRRMPFEWGVNDCGKFAADGVRAITGDDGILASLAPWATEAEAGEMLRIAGGMVKAVSAALGCRRLRTPKEAQRGDVCMIRWIDFEIRRVALGISLGATIAAPGPSGVVFVPRARAGVAWPVGR